MQRIIELSLRWRPLVLAFVALVVALGVRAALQLPIDAVPDITNVQVQVLTTAPALGPVDVERRITFPLERALSGLPDVEELRSVSRTALSAITVVFTDDTDLLRARQLITERLAIARAELPPDAEPELGPLSSGLGEILQLEVRSDRRCAAGAPDTDECHSLMELRDLLDNRVAVELRGVPGVVEVNPFGGELKTYEVRVDPERLRAHGLSLGALYEALEAANASAGGGVIARGGEQLVVRGEARVRSLEEIEDILIRARDAAEIGGVPLRVRDVAEVRLAPLLRQGAATRDGEHEVVTGIVMMLIGANGREVTNAVKDRIAEITPTLPEGVTLDVFYDRSELVDRTIRTVGTNLAEGALFVVGVLFLLLGSIRGGLVVAVAIPFSLLVAFVAMDALGISGNLMSLGAIDFGIVVDGSIIVVENALFHLGALSRGTQLGYREASELVARSTAEVRRASVFGEAIIVLVYLPVLTLAGIEGRMFEPMALTMLFALGGAFIASLTFVPVLVATFLRNHRETQDPWVVRGLARAYHPLLERALASPRALLFGCLALLAVTAMIGRDLGAELVPRLDEGGLAVQLQRLPKVSLAETVAGSLRFERLVIAQHEVTSAVCRSGRPEIATDPMGIETSDCLLALRPRDEWRVESREALVEALEARLRRGLPGIHFAFSQPIELRMSELISGTRADVAITLFGDDLGALDRTSQAIQAVLRTVPGAADVKGEPLAGMSTLEIELRRDAAARRGVRGQDVLDVVAAIGGRTVGEVYEDARRYRFQVRLEEAIREDLSALARLPVEGAVDGQPRLVELGEVATLRLVDAPASISRTAVRRRTNIEANVRGRDLASFVRDAEARVGEVPLPPGSRLVWGGQYEHLEAAAKRLAFAGPLALLVIFGLLYLAFARLGLAMLIFFDVPIAIVGGVLALAVRGMPFSISAGVGFIALSGLAVLNGVVLLSTVQRLRRDGLSALEAAREGARRRMRAVLTTATTTALGFLPMTLSTSAGAEVQRPLATVVVGGLVTATLLTLFVLPSLYAWLGDRPTRSQVDPTGSR
ncbi:MAG: efflux RND transporter permease subunit [Myxococcales bacterium]|nr:efflux RND transporter permease subunit [Myxococcales bacterium]